MIVHIPVDHTQPTLPPGSPSQYGAMWEHPALLDDVRWELEESMFQCVAATAIRCGRGLFAEHPGVHAGGSGPRPDWPHPYWYFEYLPQSELDALARSLT